MRNFKGFTIPELLVTMTIVAILSTIGVVSYMGYTSKSRDSTRTADLKNITNVLSLHKTRSSTYPTPTDGVAVTYSGSTLWTQGVFGKDTMQETGKIFGDVQDPKYKNLYTYSVTENKREYQLAAMFENQGGITALFSHHLPENFEPSQAYAADPFDPSELSPKIWFDALDIDADGDTGDNPANNANVTAWKNKSSGGSAYDAVITTGTLKYTTAGFNNNQKSVFIPENAGVLFPNSNITQGDIFYVVQNKDPFASVDNNGIGLQSSSASNFLIGFNSNRRHALRINTSPNHSITTPATTSNRGNPFIYSFHTDSVNYSFRDTGWTISQGATNSISSQEWSFNRAGAINNQGADFVVSEILIFDQKLSDENREKVEGYLAHKWGRISALPSNHPYRINPPESSGPPVPPDSDPDPFVFSDMTDVATSTQFTSNTITLSGINTLTPVSITGGEYSKNGGGFTNMTGSVNIGDTLQIRLTSSSNNSTTSTATIMVGGFSESFSVTTLVADMTPDAFSFSSVTDATLNEAYISNTVTISGLNVSVPINIQGTGALYRISDGLPTDMTNAGISTASSQYNSSNSPERAFDNITSTSGWGNNNALPAWLKYDFGEGNSQNITEYTLYRSSSQNGGWHNTQDSPRDWTFEGSNNNTNWTVLDTQNNQIIDAGATKRQYSISNSAYFRYYRINISASNRSGNNWVNITEMELISAGGNFVSTQGVVQNGDVISIKMPAASAPATSKSATLTVGSGSANYTITTVAPDISPDDFSFSSISAAPLSSLQTSNTIVVSGMNTGAPISISGVGQYRINLGAYTTYAGTVQNGDTVTLQQAASPSNSQTTSSTLTIGDKNATFNVSTPAPPPDTTPDTFSFTDMTGVSTGTLFTSNMITVSGINTASTITVSGGSYSKNGAAYTGSAGTVQNGDTISLRNTSSANFSTTLNTTLTIGGVSDIFSITTLAADNTPDPFTISAVTNAQLERDFTSNPIIVSGINIGIPISISGPGGGKYSINGGPWTNHNGIVYNGDEVRIQLKSLNSGNSNVFAEINIGGVIGRFDVNTLTPDTTPDAFVFQDITDASLNSPYISDTITVSGINTSIPLSISGGEYRIGTTGNFVSTPTSVQNGDQITLRVNSALAGGIATNVSLTLGSLSDTWTVTTSSLELSQVKNLEVPSSNIYVTGNYNGLLLHTKNADTHYVLASPSIIASDLSNPDFFHILDQKKLVYNGFLNAPSSYASLGEFTMTGGFDFPISAPLLYEGSRSDLGAYGGLKQIDEGIKSTYNDFPAYSYIAHYMDDYSLSYLEDIIGNVIGINPIKPFYCSDILRSKLVTNIAPLARISASPSAYNTYGTGGIANGITSTQGDLDYEYHSQDGNASIFFEWPTTQKIGYIKIYNRTGCCSERLSGANIKLFGANGDIVYAHTLWNTNGDYVVDLDLEGIGQLHEVKTLSLQSVDGNVLNLREIEIYLGGNIKDGIYKVDKDGLGGQSPYNVYCDMTTDGGGWTRIGENYVENGDFAKQNHIAQYTFSGASNPLSDNVIVAQVTQAPPASLPQAFVLQHNGGINDAYQLFFPKIPGNYFAQEIRLSAWVKGTTASIFHNTVDYGTTQSTTQPDYDILTQEVSNGWSYQQVRIPLTGLVQDFTWNVGKNVAGPFYITGLKMEVYYR